MRAVGETLRKEREARGVSLQEISEETKISMRFLRAIEEEHFDRLPGGVFNKNFVRQYARYLGLDEETAVQDYLRIAGANRESSEGEKCALPLEMQPSPSGRGYFRIVLSAICLGALAVGLVYGLYRLKNRVAPSTATVGGLSTTPVAASSAPSIPSSVGAAAVASTEPSSPGLATPAESNLAGSAPENPTEAAPRGRNAGEGKLQETGIARQESEPALDLRIASVAPVWLSITTDGQEHWRGTLQPRQTKQVKASDSIRLTVGDAGAVELSLNGNSLPPLGRPGEVKRFTITPQGLEPSP
ncbi:MAG: hypothetical protein A3G20_00720 [Acidobacteria bacterium RIFCSPLOWO2_12_FULL_59_11]|nr:MAG: hypothetical protein A3G20_00720 [Acidobacteria bacterium RIFCSPLOWO2_12_FULL_59_11]